MLASAHTIVADRTTTSCQSSALRPPSPRTHHPTPEEAMAPLRIGLIGAGRIVPAHLRGYAALRAAGQDDFRITAICSRDPARARLFLAPDSGRQASASTWQFGDPLEGQAITVADF